MRDVLVPPVETRLWVGPFESEREFIDSGRATIRMMLELSALRPNDAVLDVGCGCGRLALPLTDLLSSEGRYLGFDVGLAPITWCREHITPRFPNFVFAHVDVYSPGYNAGGTIAPEDFTFPCDDDSVDLALLGSVFTHLLPKGVEAYTRQIARVLRPSGKCLISHMLMDEAARQAVTTGTTIFDFRHQVGPATTFDPGNPTEGLAYDVEFALGVLGASGLDVTDVRRGNWREVRSYNIQHDWVLAVKRGVAPQPAVAADGALPHG
jgi:SAM-dependent methyltransferase